MDKFSYRNGSLEVRSTSKGLTGGIEHSTAEIIKWFKDDKNCYVIAYWQIEEEGYNLRFVGNRPFDRDIDKLLFMKLAEFGQEELNRFYNGLEKD